MQIIKRFKSSLRYEEELPETADLHAVVEQVDKVNNIAAKHGFSKVVLDINTRKISFEYVAKKAEEIDFFADESLKYKNGAMENALYTLICLCNVLSSPPEITLLNKRSVPCKPVARIISRDAGDRNKNWQLFSSNVNLFFDKSEEIFNDSRMFLAPVHCGKNCFSGDVPTLGVFVEFWQKCRELSIEGARLPICSIVGNPMTGSHCCVAIAPDGSHVKARLNLSFLELVKIFRYINERYDHLKDVCQTYTLEEVVNLLK